MDSSSFVRKKPSSSSFSSLDLTAIIPVALLLLLSPFLFSDHRHSSLPPSIIIRPPASKPDPFITNTCSNTFYPSLCFQTLSTFPHNLHQNNSTRLRHALQYTIQKTINRVTKSRIEIIGSSSFDTIEQIWINNCVELMHLTVYELQESIKQLTPIEKDRLSYDTLKNILGAAMTNKNTCIQDFIHLKLNNHMHSRVGRYMQKSLTPIMRMICNGLGIINYLESEGRLAYSCPGLDDRF